MSISYDLDGTEARRSWSRPLLVLLTANGLFMMATLCAWTFLSLFLAEPLAWATWMRVHRGSNFMEIFDYPFVLLWLLPAGGMSIAWVASQSRRWGTAYASLTLPIIVLGFVYGWYYLAPTDWH
jgi:hypothetical protein